MGLDNVCVCSLTNRVKRGYAPIALKTLSTEIRQSNKSGKSHKYPLHARGKMTCSRFPWVWYRLSVLKCLSKCISVMKNYFYGKACTRVCKFILFSYFHNKLNNSSIIICTFDLHWSKSVDTTYMYATLFYLHIALAGSVQISSTDQVAHRSKNTVRKNG